MVITYFSCSDKNINTSSKGYGELGNTSLYSNTKKLLRYASITIGVSDYDKTLSEVKEEVEKIGAKIVSDDFNISDSKKYGNIRIRVHSTNFFKLIEILKQIGNLKSYSVQSEDITEEISKLNTRLGKTKKSEKKEEIEERLIELNDDVTYNTIYLNIEERLGFFTAIVSGISTGLANFTDIISGTFIVIIALSPFLIFLILIRLFYALIKKRWKGLIGKIETLL